MRRFAQRLKTSVLTFFWQVFFTNYDFREFLKNATTGHLDTINVAYLLYRKLVFRKEILQNLSNLAEIIDLPFTLPYLALLCLSNASNSGSPSGG